MYGQEADVVLSDFMIQDTPKEWFWTITVMDGFLVEKDQKVNVNRTCLIVYLWFKRRCHFIETK